VKATREREVVSDEDNANNSSVCGFGRK